MQKKEKTRNCKSIIIQLIISLVIFIVVFALMIYDYSISITTKFYSRIGYYALFLGLSFIGFLEGLFSLSSLKKKNKNKEEATNIDKNNLE